MNSRHIISLGLGLEEPWNGCSAKKVYSSVV